MPTSLLPGRVTARSEGEFVVFLLGMRIHSVLAVGTWLPIARTMPRMMAQLAARPELGLLHSESFVGWRTFFFVQYWRSFEHLERFARDRSLEHVPAWKDFNQRVAKTGKVGIFHETYLVRADASESIYVNMQPFGLSRAFGSGAIAARGHAAAKRIGLRAQDDPSEPVPRAPEGFPPGS